jgi:hypothetical protein
MSSTGDPPIIITGGSVTVDFGSNHSQFQNDGRGKHKHDDKTIERIEVIGDGLNIDEAIADGKVTVKIYYK